ncbi:hypothetical protein [Nostoc sp.]|uniref:hypothetical protein n=1 Tax=Nostoc sp. TaxID=1180 RepID=UPI002FF54BBF
MKAFFQGWVVAILVMAAAIAGNIQAVMSQNIKTGNFLFAQTQIKADELELAVALPELAEVFFKKGESTSSGRVIGIDAQGQALLIQRNGKTAKIPLSQIARVVFKKEALAHRSNRSPIIRGGGERPTGKPVTWSGIPINNFTLKNSTQGQAVVKLKPPVVSTAQLQGIQSVARNRQYVVDEIQFNSQQKTITILAKPY